MKKDAHLQKGLRKGTSLMYNNYLFQANDMKELNPTLYLLIDNEWI